MDTGLETVSCVPYTHAHLEIGEQEYFQMVRSTLPVATWLMFHVPSTLCAAGTILHCTRPHAHMHTMQ